MTDETAERVASFLKELSALTLKYRLEIGGCGCCGSPYVQEVDAGEEIPDGSHYKIVNGSDYLRFVTKAAE